MANFDLIQRFLPATKVSIVSKRKLSGTITNTLPFCILIAEVFLLEDRIISAIKPFPCITFMLCLKKQSADRVNL